MAEDRAQAGKAVADALAALPRLEGPPPPTLPGRRRKWPWIGAGSVPVLLAFIFWPRLLPQSEHEAETYPDLPEWFQPAHRVARVPFGPVTAQGNVYVEGKGWIPADQAPPPGNFTEAWLEKHFTHYLHRNSFYWSIPKLDNAAADGKILAGTKVIMGKKLDDLTLVCTRTRDNRVINMYVRSQCLRDRFEGPPALEHDD